MRSTPHSGFHGNEFTSPYFEGWYSRITIPSTDLKAGLSFAFMCSIQNPSSHQPVCAVQIIGPADEYIWSPLTPSAGRGGFLACPGTMRHCCRILPSSAPSPDPAVGSSPGEAPPQNYTVTPHEHSGEIFDRSQGIGARWHFLVDPVYGWGGSGRRQRSTAGWMSRFQLFEPGWQVLMAHGRARGWIDWRVVWGDDRPRTFRSSFQEAPFYAEKNWGVSFPRRWFWIQCNCFRDHPSLTLTSAGGIRRMLGREETLGMIGIHHADVFHEFVPWNSQVSWRISPWGSWQIWACSRSHAVELIGRTEAPGVRVKVPTRDGLLPLCRDTTHGDLSLVLWELEGDRRRPLLSARTDQAGLEIGGGDWDGTWTHPASP